MTTDYDWKADNFFEIKRDILLETELWDDTIKQRVLDASGRINEYLLNLRDEQVRQALLYGLYELSEEELKTLCRDKYGFEVVIDWMEGEDE